MWIKSSGQVTENVYQITTAVSSHFLIGGECAGLVDAGVAAMSGRLEEQLSQILEDREQLEYLFLTHTHFDHLGGIPFLRSYAPKLKLVMAPLSAEILGKRENLLELYEKNVQVAEALKLDIGCSKEEWCKAFKVDRLIGDGDVIDLGADVTVKLISCPGHTADTVAYYVRPDGALAAAEAVGGYSGRDKQSCCFLTSYQDYLASLDKLSLLEVKALSLPHGGTLTGQLAGKFLSEARVLTERFAVAVSERLQAGELIDEIYLSLVPDWNSQNLCPEGPFVSEQESALRQMIQAVAAEKSAANA